jgi:tRNA(fMet)-specific endonuclease VapC
MPGSVAADTSVVILMQNGDPAAAAAFADADEVFLPFAVKGELRYAAIHSRRPAANLERLALLFDECPAIPSDDLVEREYAAIRAELRAKGRPIPENDIWIAACARSRGLPLLCRDQHFALVDRLEVRRV